MYMCIVFHHSCLFYCQIAFSMHSRINFNEYKIGKEIKSIIEIAKQMLKKLTSAYEKSSKNISSARIFLQESKHSDPIAAL